MSSGVTYSMTVVNGIQKAEALPSRHSCRSTPRSGSVMTTVTTVLKIKLTIMATPKADNSSITFSLALLTLLRKIPTLFATAIDQARNAATQFHQSHDR